MTLRYIGLGWTMLLYGLYTAWAMRLLETVPADLPWVEISIMALFALIWWASLVMKESLPRFAVVIGEMPIISPGLIAALGIIIFQAAVGDLVGFMPGYKELILFGYSICAWLIGLDVVLALQARRELRAVAQTPSGSAAEGKQ
jgi:hypothetical protein